jgi:hypothetical protein
MLKQSEMTGRPLVESLLAVAGIWLVARQFPDYAAFAILALSGALPVSGIAPGVFSTQALHFLWSVGVGGLLIFLRRPIARWIHPANSGETVSCQGLLTAGLGVLSIYFIGSGLIALGRLVGQIGMGIDMAFQAWNGVVSILVGGVLFICARWIGRKLETGS